MGDRLEIVKQILSNQFLNLMGDVFQRNCIFRAQEMQSWRTLLYFVKSWKSGQVTWKGIKKALETSASSQKSPAFTELRKLVNVSMGMGEHVGL